MGGLLPSCLGFLERFLCLVTYLYIMGLVSGQRLLREPLGLVGAGWRGLGWRASKLQLSGFEENNSVIFITTCFFLILKYGK